MSEKLARTRAKRAGNRSIITKLLQEAECLIEAEPIDEPRLKVLAATLDERLNLVKSFDEKVIETCKVDEVESEIVEADEFNSRVMEIVRKIIKNYHTDRFNYGWNNKRQKYKLWICTINWFEYWRATRKCGF